VIELNPNDANAYFNRGSCFAKADNFGPAIEDLQKAVQIDPSDGNYYRVLGNTKYRYNELENDPCTDWQKASELGDKKAAFSIKRFCQDN
jgi:tetratricopeptide (TPR) repeat protein